MSDAAGDDRTEEPTQRALEKAREEGNVARSPELGAAATMVAGSMLLLVAGGSIMTSMSDILRGSLYSLGGPSVEHLNGIAALRDVASALGAIVIPIFLLLLAVALGQSLAQTGGPMFVPAALRPKPEKFLPSEGLKRMFSMRAVIRVGFSLARLFVLLGLVATILTVLRKDILGLADQGLHAGLSRLGSLALITFAVMSLCLLLLGLFEYAAQRWQWRRGLRMTKQQIKDEHKSQEGDPKLKGQLKSLRRNMLESSLSSAVQSSQVVVTNPTHYAVCLKYDDAEHAAPVVTAKGVDELAAEIRSLARRFGVTIVPQPSLARSLFSRVPVGRPVPEALYQAVASVFVLVQRMRERRKGAES